jgi:hypothetical protein
MGSLVVSSTTTYRYGVGQDEAPSKILRVLHRRRVTADVLFVSNTRRAVTTPTARAAPEHLSFSQTVDFEQCPKSWELERLHGAAHSETPSWWLVGGSTFHSVIETYLKQRFNREGK